MDIDVRPIGNRFHAVEVDQRYRRSTARCRDGPLGSRRHDRRTRDIHIRRTRRQSRIRRCLIRRLVLGNLHQPPSPLMAAQSTHSFHRRRSILPLASLHPPLRSTRNRHCRRGAVLQRPVTLTRIQYRNAIANVGNAQHQPL